MVTVKSLPPVLSLLIVTRALPSHLPPNHISTAGQTVGTTTTCAVSTVPITLRSGIWEGGREGGREGGYVVVFSSSSSSRLCLILQPHDLSPLTLPPSLPPSLPLLSLPSFLPPSPLVGPFRTPLMPTLTATSTVRLVDPSFHYPFLSGIRCRGSHSHVTTLLPALAPETSGL